VSHACCNIQRSSQRSVVAVVEICSRCQPWTEVSPTPPKVRRAALRRRRRLFAEPLCFASCLQMVSLRPVLACFAILYTVGGVIDHPPPPHSSWNWMSVTAALAALSVFGASGTSGVKSGTATRLWRHQTGRVFTRLWAHIGPCGLPDTHYCLFSYASQSRLSEK
jgi:hypothetical protein